MAISVRHVAGPLRAAWLVEAGRHGGERNVPSPIVIDEDAGAVRAARRAETAEENALGCRGERDAIGLRKESSQKKSHN